LRAFDEATNKALLADFLTRHEISHPPSIVMTAGIPSADRLSALTFPILAKPPLLNKGAGIRRLETIDDLASFAAGRPGDECWVLQDFIDGYDLCVNVLCRDGKILAATVQHAIKLSSTPYRPMVGMEFKDDPAAMGIVEQLMHALNWSGVACVDLRFDARRKKVLVLEVNGRYWNSLLGSLNAGVNFPLLACEMSLGELKANRMPYKARYFLGESSMLLSLVGGGKFRIMSNETNLPYSLRDPLHAASRLMLVAINKIRTLVGVWFARFKGWYPSN
jgi:predicted ATP-grasp superfamily ATP-dependent carboligase